MQWSVDLHPVTGEWRIIDRDGEIVCVSLHGEQHLAKIAAAPDMFEVCATFPGFAANPADLNAWNKLRLAALAKAAPSRSSSVEG